MIVTEIRSTLHRRRRQKPISNGKYTYSESGTIITRVRTDDGIEGIGFAGGQAGPDRVIWEAARSLGKLALGLDVFEVELLWDKMFQPKLYGRRGLTTRAMASIDIAMWDAAGKTIGVPLYKMLGGFRKKVPAYLAGGYYVEGKGIDGLEKEMREKVEAGAQCVKMKIGGAPMSEDVQRVRAARDAVGPEIGLMVDANNAYSPLEAIQFARRVEKYELYWFEEPVHAEDYQGLAKVKANTVIPIATGENEYTRYGFRDLIACGGADILQADANVLGGVTEWKHIASMAGAYGLPMAPHGSALLHVHLVAAVSNGLIVEHVISEGTASGRSLFTTKLNLDGGMVGPPDTPGHGIEVDEEALTACVVAEEGNNP
jgi:L-alanine-DL-glutamate epimerase-like enolase superfamily enzyme